MFAGSVAGGTILCINERVANKFYAVYICRKFHNIAVMFLSFIYRNLFSISAALNIIPMKNSREESSSSITI